MTNFKTLKEWNPDIRAENIINMLISSLDEHSIYNVYNLNNLKPPAIKHTLEYFRGNKIPAKTLKELLIISKDNMKQLYDNANFYGGWNDTRKLSEFKFYKTHIIIVRDELQKVVGFVTFRFLIMRDNQPATPVAYIYELQVLEDYQSNGVGRYMIGLLSEVSRLISCTKLMCTVLKSNVRAVSFYRNKCNFINDESDDTLVNYHILKLLI